MLSAFRHTCSCGLRGHLVIKVHYKRKCALCAQCVSARCGCGTYHFWVAICFVCFFCLFKDENLFSHLCVSFFFVLFKDENLFSHFCLKSFCATLVLCWMLNSFCDWAVHFYEVNIGENKSVVEASLVHSNEFPSHELSNWHCWSCICSTVWYVYRNLLLLSVIGWLLE